MQTRRSNPHPNPPPQGGREKSASPKLDLCPFYGSHAAGARPASSISRKGRLRFEKAVLCPGIAKTHSTHNQRRTAVRASENVTSCLPGQRISPCLRKRTGIWTYNTATTVYRPNRQGASRSTVFSVQPRVLSKPR